MYYKDIYQQPTHRLVEIPDTNVKSVATATATDAFNIKSFFSNPWVIGSIVVIILVLMFMYFYSKEQTSSQLGTLRYR